MPFCKNDLRSFRNILPKIYGVRVIKSHFVKGKLIDSYCRKIPNLYPFFTPDATEKRLNAMEEAEELKFEYLVKKELMKNSGFFEEI